MNLKSPHSKQNRAVALVITLLFLSIITFLAIAFLAMTSRDKSAVNASLDVSTARSMSESALARAQAEVIAKMMATNDILNYDYMASHNFVNPNGYAAEASYDPSDVNYDTLLTNGGSLNANWASNIANLFYDPRAPVFVVTNSTGSTDFRFWVDINRNGRFETNGPVATIDPTGAVVPNLTSLENGEPEWIGVLKYPETNHSVINPFIGRYAFMVLPIGKTLDLNYIGNAAKFAASPNNDPNMLYDGYIRDEGVGSWELNLGALLNDLGPMFQTNPLFGNYAGTYQYTPNAAFIVTPNLGVNYDASQFVAFRYGSNPSYPPFLGSAVGNPVFPSSLFGYIDEYGIGPSTTYPFDYSFNPSNLRWPGTYSSNMFYDVQDLFDSSKTGTNFPRNLAYAVGQIDTTNRYTFQRLIDSIGMGSSPEYGVYVYPNFSVIGNSPYPIGVPSQSVLRTKVNINYDNTAQIQAGPYTPSGTYTPMPTNLAVWSPLGFFTNAAESLLRSQIYVFTNYTTNSAGAFVASNYLYMSFGVTNIPVYVPNNPGIVYNEQVHRMLQLAANIYASAYASNLNTVPQPPVFRPQLAWSNYGTPSATLYITGYVPAPSAQATLDQIASVGFKDVTNSTIGPTDFVWGIPWIVGAAKGIPAFDQYSYTSRIFYNREVLFVRQTNAAGPITNKPPASTNQFYVMCISNNFAMDAWNPYSNNFIGASGGLTVYATNFVTVTLTNNYNFGTNITFGNYYLNLNPYAYWPAMTNPSTSLSITNEFRTFLQTNIVTVPLGYYSENSKAFVVFSNATAEFADGFQPQDIGQTGWPVHNWSLNITNHVCYALIDGNASAGTILDFVNLGPFGSSTSISSLATASPDQGNNEFSTVGATDSPNSPMSAGLRTQIGDAISSSGGANFNNALNGRLPSVGGAYFTTSAQAQTSILTPYYVTDDVESFMACDPFVHYTVGDLIYPGFTGNQHPSMDSTYLAFPVTNSAGLITLRYINGISTSSGNMVLADPGLGSANDWQFPTNRFPGVGWLGRVHRGTPWQTVYLKSDSPGQVQNWSPVVAGTAGWVNSAYTYPTNDWSLIDLFTAVPNDNAARGLLSVNQTNDAAWAAVFAGVVALTNGTGGIPISPTNDAYNFYALAIDGLAGMNATRATNRNGLFHHIGDILQSAPLTVSSPYIANAGRLNDEMVERIPQQTLSLLKVGLPQFVIYSWGQSLKPKNLYSGGNANLVDLCTNYEITGEYLTRTVCHVVSTDGTTTAPKIIVDSFNIEPGN